MRVGEYYKNQKNVLFLIGSTAEWLSSSIFDGINNVHNNV